MVAVFIFQMTYYFKIQFPPPAVFSSLPAPWKRLRSNGVGAPATPCWRPAPPSGLSLCSPRARPRSATPEDTFAGHTGILLLALSGEAAVPLSMQDGLTSRTIWPPGGSVAPQLRSLAPCRELGQHPALTHLLLPVEPAWPTLPTTNSQSSQHTMVKQLSEQRKHFIPWLLTLRRQSKV